MIDYKLVPYKELTFELVDRINIHQTVSSLRRAGDDSPCIKEFNGTLDIPKLYYIKGSKNPDINDWSIHALDIDIQKWLLMQAVRDMNKPVDPVDPVEPKPEPTPVPTASTIKWDGVIGKPEEGELTATVTGKILVYKGTIKRYLEGEAQSLGFSGEGNYVCSIITPSKGAMDKYPNAVCIFADGTEKPLSEVVEPDGIQLIDSVEPGFESTFVIAWSDDLTETFVIRVTEDSICE